MMDSFDFIIVGGRFDEESSEDLEQARLMS